ncbi:MAG: Zn-dependent oligopeptidase [Glaciecola sp.]|jgi:Zn-dependent oligopeptidase
MSNPLLQKTFNTPFESIPFTDIQLTHYKPAFEQAIKDNQQEIDGIVNESENPSFENTIEALEKSGATLSQVSSIFYNLNSAETSDEMQAIAQEVSPLLSEHSSDVLLNKALFERVKAVYDQIESLKLNAEEHTLLTKSYKKFARNGALLNEQDKTQVREISKDLSLLNLNFAENILAENKAFELHLTDEKQLEGLPKSAKEAAYITAKGKDKKGWLFTLDYPSVIPFLTYADNRELREKMYRAFSSRSNNGNEQDNKANVLAFAKLREQKANLLGYNTHADYVLEERMAKSAKTVLDFQDKMYEASYQKATQEAADLQSFASSINGPSPIQKWDVGYYAEKLKTATLNFDEEKMKPYFKLENVIDGVFTVANKLFGLTFTERKDIPVYHEDVKTFEINDEKGNFVALFYGDFFPREGKQGGAWMTLFKEQHISEGINHRPHVVNVCNFTKPTETKPSLLTFNEVTTLFHEFGHGLHGLLANTKYESLSGTNVMWDFVELPSQVLENWCYEKECLDLFAKHYETGESIPQEYIDQIKSAQTFRSGSGTLRQLSFGKLDMNWHGTSVKNVTNVEVFEAESLSKFELYPAVEGSCGSTGFAHIFNGGYSSGYYSYKWAEVLDADAFEYFKEEGIFNKNVAKSFYDNVLSKGGTEDPTVLYKRFRGRNAIPNALLKRSGLA